MYSFFKRVLQFIIDPLGVHKTVQEINIKASAIQGDIYHVNLRNAELLKAVSSFERRMDEYYFLKAVRNAMDAMMPDMLWAKDIHGRYIIANKAIRERLLQDCSPYGKNDVELANAIKERIGNDMHTFGEICGNSDKVVLENDTPMKFNEDGLINGEYVMLQVHKNTIKDRAGNIIGTVGVGRDITFEVNELRDIANTTTCTETKERIEKLLAYFEYKG